MVMDNTKANRAARKLLKQDFPYMVQLGCQAHGLSLFIKDLAKTKKTTWTSAATAKALMMVNTME